MGFSVSGFDFISLFAGIGGGRMALEAAGGTCVGAVENDKFAVQTYNANAELPIRETDVRQVLAGHLPEFDWLIAGFPCQPFSLAGVSKKASLGLAHGFDDAKGGNLFFEIMRIVDAASPRPEVLFLENVKNLLSHDGGRTFRVIKDAIEDRGYNLSYSVIDSYPWVPQHRLRILLIALDQGVFGDQFFEFPPSPPVSSGPVLGDILEKDVDPKYTLSDKLWASLKSHSQRHSESGHGFGYGLVGHSDVSRTLSARYGKDGSEILVAQDGLNPRRLTPEECRRLMGFPEGFVIPVSDTQAYKQFGNSVVVPALAYHAQAIVYQAYTRPSAARFRAAVMSTHYDHPYGRGMDVLSQEEYERAELFMTPDGLGGAAVLDGDLVSVFSHPVSRCEIGPVISEASSHARTLNCFTANGSQLEHMYRMYGWKTVAYLAFDPDLAPEGVTMENGGNVAFMVRAPGSFEAISTSSYDEAVEAQVSALGRK